MDPVGSFLVQVVDNMPGPHCGKGWILVHSVEHMLNGIQEVPVFRRSGPSFHAYNLGSRMPENGSIHVANYVGHALTVISHG